MSYPKDFLQFGSESGKLLRKWFVDLEEYNRGGRAALRRAPSLDHVYQVQVFHTLRKQLIPLELTDAEKERASLRVAAIAALVTNLKEDLFPDRKCPPKERLGERMARPSHADDQEAETGRPVVSLPRFRRLMQCESVEDMYRPMRRVIKLLGGRACLLELARVVFWWESPKTRRNLAVAYYNRLPSKP